MHVFKLSNGYFLSVYKNSPAIKITKLTDDFVKLTLNSAPLNIVFDGEQRVEFLRQWFEINKATKKIETAKTF